MVAKHGDEYHGRIHKQSPNQNKSKIKKNKNHSIQEAYPRFPSYHSNLTKKNIQTKKQIQQKPSKVAAARVLKRKKIHKQNNPQKPRRDCNRSVITSHMDAFKVNVGWKVETCRKTCGVVDSCHQRSHEIKPTSDIPLDIQGHLRFGMTGPPKIYQKYILRRWPWMSKIP